MHFTLRVCRQKILARILALALDLRTCFILCWTPSSAVEQLAILLDVCTPSFLLLTLVPDHLNYLMQTLALTRRHLSFLHVKVTRQIRSRMRMDAPKTVQALVVRDWSAKNEMGMGKKNAGDDDAQAEKEGS